MPIYAYRCERCGHAKDVIQKFSDTPLTVCPECGADAFRKQLTAPAFQLKGSGWYVTDFRDNGAKSKTAKPAEADGSGTAPAKDAPAAPASTSAGEGGSSGGSAGTAPAAAPAPASAPSTKAST